MGDRVWPDFQEALVLAWTLLYSLAVLQAGLMEEAHPESLQTRMERHPSHL